MKMAWSGALIGRSLELLRLVVNSYEFLRVGGSTLVIRYISGWNRRLRKDVLGCCEAGRTAPRNLEVAMPVDSYVGAGGLPALPRRSLVSTIPAFRRTGRSFQSRDESSGCETFRWERANCHREGRIPSSRWEFSVLARSR